MEDDHYEIQMKVFRSSNGDIQSNILFGTGKYSIDINKTSYRNNSNTITNMTSRELNTVYEKGLSNTDNASSNEILTITIRARFSLLYSNKRKHNSLVRKVVNKTKANITTVFIAKKDNPISLKNNPTSQRYITYVNQLMVSNTTLYSKGNILHNTMHNKNKVSNNYEVDVFTTDGHRRTITLSTEDILNANHFFGIKIIRNKKEDKHKMYNVSEKYIVKYKNKYL